MLSGLRLPGKKSLVGKGGTTMGERVAALGVKIFMVGHNDILEAQVLLAELGILWLLGDGISVSVEDLAGVFCLRVDE